MSFKKPLQVLHVDDSSILRKTVARSMEGFKEYYELTQVGSVDEALDLLSAGQTFDVILTDWQMSGKSGLTLLCTLKADPNYHYLPVFFLTSEYEGSSLLTAVTYGAGGILKKPITGAEIHSYLTKRRSFIDESHANKENSFVADATEILKNIKQVLPLNRQQGLATCLQQVKNLKTKATSLKWPLIADYCQKIEDAIELTIKKELELLSPLTGLVVEFHSFIEKCVSDIEKGKPHPFLTEFTEKNLKNYHENVEAGWFAEKGNEDISADGVFLSNEALTELRNHLTPEGLLLLEKYSKKRSE
ncbi:response regulator [Bdellovibrio sp. SKB1291214]|uniref:response regulator n=1 Tax=Bdellovibrio sp. SKB1291214 TaxID=1732569 RepID=UPI0015956085|nr:response regulator [Bdellovibrio sp. SKB1291214]UYL10292.1 response regulator [Bdellovibrio sp. SKB1291214]